MRFVEETEAQWSAEQLAAAERQIEDQKREWEENRLAALRQEEERRTKQQEEDNEMLTFSREDATNQVGNRRNKHGNTFLGKHNKNKISKNKSSRTVGMNRRAGNSTASRRPNNRKRFNKRDSVRIDDKPRNVTQTVTANANRARRAIIKPKTIEQCDDVDNDPKHSDHIPNDNKQHNETKTSASISAVTKAPSETKMDVDEDSASDDAVVSEQKTPTRRKTLALKASDDDDDEDEEDEVTTTKLVNKKQKNSYNKFNSTPNTNTSKTENNDDSTSSDEELSKVLSLKSNHLNNSSRDQDVTDNDTNTDDDDNESEADESSECSSDDDSDDSIDKKQLIPNKLDHNSPRTRSRGTVKINLWTLDVSPILPGVKPVNKVRSGTPPSKKQKNQTNTKSVDKCNNKKSEDRDNLSISSESLIEECKTTKVSVVMTDVLTNVNIDVLQNNSVSSTSEIQETKTGTDTSTNTNTNTNANTRAETKTDAFKKPKGPLKHRNQKSLDAWVSKLPNATNAKRPATPIPNRTRRSIKSDDAILEPPKKLKTKTDTSNGPLT